MKHKKRALFRLTAVFLMLFSLTLVSYAGENTDTLPDWELKITVPEGAESMLDTGEGSYYISTMDPASIPYVMIHPNWGFSSEEDFLDTFFLDYMQEQYPDLSVTGELSDIQIGDRTYKEMIFSYSVSGYTVRDRRLFRQVGGITYMFCSKEVEELNLTLGSLLDEVAAGCEYLGEESGGSQTETELLSQTEPQAVPSSTPDLLSFAASHGMEAVAGTNGLPVNTGQEEDLIALDDVGISIKAAGYTAVREEDGFVYIYTDADDSIPYVLIGRYDTGGTDFADRFTDYMSDNYQDLQIVSEAAPITVGDIDFTRIEYTYAISGYPSRDIRLFREISGRTYMLASKEVPDLDLVLPSGYLEEIAAGMEMLAGGYSDYENHVDSSQSMSRHTDSTPGSARESTEDTDSAVTGNADSADTGDIGISQSVAAGSLSGSIAFREDSSPYAGTWVPFDDGFRLYVPSEWDVLKITEEMYEDGILYQAASSSDEETAPWISVNFTDSRQIADTLEELEQSLVDENYWPDGILDVNGIPCIAYRTPKKDLSGLAFFHPGGQDYIMFVVGFEYSSNIDMIGTILCSLNPAA